MARIIAVINQKGGVGKTTTVVNLGAALAKKGKKVLLIDMDPQANLSCHLGLGYDRLDASIYDVMKEEKKFTDIIVKRNTNLHIAPATLDLSGAEIELVSVVGREAILKRAISDAQKKYAFVLIDCPPSLGLLTLNALTASQEIFITIQTEFLALYGMSKLIETIHIIQERINPQLFVSGIIPVMYDKRKKLCREVLESIKKYFKDEVFTTNIRENISLAEAPGHQKTIFEYAPRSNGAKDYLALATEVIKLKARTNNE